MRVREVSAELRHKKLRGSIYTKNVLSRGDACKIARELNFLTLDEASKRSGLRFWHLVGIETGVRTLTLVIARKLSKLYHVPVKVLRRV